MAAKTYFVQNGHMQTTAAPVKVTTNAVITTMLQIAPVASPIRVIQWGCSYDGDAAAVPGEVELIDTGTVFGTVTAYAAADVMPHGDPNALANTAGSSGVPLGLGTALSGFTCTSEGSITAVRTADLQLLNPNAGSYYLQFPLGREFEVPSGHCLRIRNTFAVAVNAYYYVIFEC